MGTDGQGATATTPAKRGAQTPQADRGGKIAVLVGVALLVAGGVLIGVAWDRASNLDYVQGQFPYLLSGSIPGIALIIVGATIIVIQLLRQDAAERADQLDKLVASVTELAALVGTRDEYDPALTGEYRPRPRVPTNGSGHPAPADDATQQIGAVKAGEFEEGR
jgi:hypothetical protein